MITSKQAQTTNTCPCCGQTLAFVGVQTYPAKYNRPDKVLVECNHYGCALYLDTGTIEGLAETWQARNGGAK